MTSPFPPASRLVAYLRDSGGRDQDLSILQQGKAAGDWCREHGHILTRVFADAARSGTSLAGRDQFLAMIDYLEDGGAEKGVLLYELARFSRQFDDTLYYLADLRRRGYIVHSITDAVPDTLDGRLIESITAWKNAKYSDDLKRLVKRGQAYIVHQHHAVLGGTPTGYKRVEIEIGLHRDGSPHTISNLVPDEKTVPLVRRAFEMRAAGATMAELHAEVGLYPWIKNYSYMFRNPRYIGVYPYDGGEIAGYCQPIIDRNTWDAVQTLTDQRASRHGFNHPRAVRSRFILTGLLRCGACGSPMIGRVLKRKSYPDYLSYKCTAATNLDQTCRASLIRKELIEQRIIRTIQQRILIPSIMASIYQRARRMMTENDAGRQAALERARGEIHSTQKAIARLVAAIREAGHSAALIAELAALEEQQRQAEQRLAGLEASRPRELPDLDMDQIAAVLTDKLSSAPAEEVAQVLRGFIVSIVAQKPRGKELTGTVTYRLPVAGADQEFSVPL